METNKADITKGSNYMYENILNIPGAVNQFKFPTPY